jgi:hypothetical protein
MGTQLVSVKRDASDADCLLIALKVDVGMLDRGDTPRLAANNRMAGERLYSWLSGRVPRPVFEGFLRAAERDGSTG